ncbi:MAG: WD40/YVTN/BNR-like repeat-containing protein [Bacteroidia bacterium]
MKTIKYLIASLLLVIGAQLYAQKGKKDEKKPEKPTIEKESTYSVLKWRSIGPAVTSGRIIDLAVDASNPSTWYVATAGGGVFKTINAGTTFDPIFDQAGAYSTGCIAIDPTNTNVVWVGSGENNNQRSVSYGDGIYKSEDGGKSFKNVGLKNSEHIGMITIDPNNSNIVYVAAYGPLWSAGGDRGIYKTEDGGKTWKNIFTVSENTGFNEIHMDPRDSKVLYATAHQRRRHEWTYISGGPESAIYKSTDAGTTWDKLTGGLPNNDMGRIAMDICPSNPDILYAMIEATDGNGFYKSTDRGASWSKLNGHATAGNYYQEIICDPKDENVIYSMDTWAHVSTDGGKSFHKLGEKFKHVDNHCVYIFPNDTKHMLMGCDGGLYETFDGAKTWNYKANIPVTQFYRVCVDNSKPFYYVYGGTQDNNTLGGPSRTKSGSGITNADWFVTVGGDGFQSRVDPKEPNIVYSEWQYGGLIRFDRNTGEQVSIKPMEKQGEKAFRWNWDSPLLISAFDNKRLYFAANKVFRSNNRGDKWEAISEDLTRGIDRNKLPVMGKVWSMDAVAKNQSTSIFGNIVSLSESPKNENILFAGTDDGLIHVTSDGGKSWTKIDKFPGVPELKLGGYTIGTFVQYITASQHEESTVYAAFNNHRQGDFKPYLLKSTDKGKSWQSIASDLPERGSVYCIVEDHKNPNLLFCGTEYGIYFTLNGGKSWTKLMSGLPAVTSVRDIAIQKDENDLVIATFGRGFYILDDYAMLQNIKAEDLNTNKILPVSDRLVFIESTPYGHKEKSFQGASFFTAENPPMGAVINYNLTEEYKSLKDKRKELEKERIKKNLPVYYPSPDSIRMEDNEIAPLAFLVITDKMGNDVKKIEIKLKKGVSQVVWDGRYEVTAPINFHVFDKDNPYAEEEKGPIAIPGIYNAQLTKLVNGSLTPMCDMVAFNLKSLNQSSIPVKDVEKQQALNMEIAEFRRVVLGTSDYVNHLKNRIKYLNKGIKQSGVLATNISKDIIEFEKQLDAFELIFNGDRSLAKREFETTSGFVNDMETMVYYTWAQTYGSTDDLKSKYEELKPIFSKHYQTVLNLKSLVEKIEAQAEDLKMPATYGRLPKWN